MNVALAGPALEQHGNSKRPRPAAANIADSPGPWRLDPFELHNAISSVFNLIRLEWQSDKIIF